MVFEQCKNDIKALSENLAQKQAIYATTLRKKDLENELLQRQQAELQMQLKLKNDQIYSMGNQNALNDQFLQTVKDLLQKLTSLRF